MLHAVGVCTEQISPQKRRSCGRTLAPGDVTKTKCEQNNYLYSRLNAKNTLRAARCF